MRSASRPAALRPVSTDGSTERVPAFELEVTDEFVQAVAVAVVGLLGWEHQQHRPQAEWLTTVEAADYLRTSKHRVYRLVHMRRIPHHKEGQRVLFDRAELEAWVRDGGGKRVA